MKLVLAMSLGLVTAIATADIGAAQAQSGKGRQAIMDRFEMLDANTDSQIAQDEAREWVEIVFAAMDNDEDGKITRDEYMALQLGQGADPDQRGRRYAEKQAEKDARFTRMDADSDGYVTQDQFFADSGEKFATADADNSGSLSLSEFMAADL